MLFFNTCWHFIIYVNCVNFFLSLQATLIFFKGDDKPTSSKCIVVHSILTLYVSFVSYLNFGEKTIGF